MITTSPRGKEGGGSVVVHAGQVKLEGTLIIPEGAIGIVAFAHGSGSSRFSPRNNFVASVLQKAKIGTLLIDLLTPAEDDIYQNRFDISLLAERLNDIVDWLGQNPETMDLPVGLFGASTGAAAAIIAAARSGSTIKAIVSRGGRPDLALDALASVQCPTLLIVGGKDYEVIELNERAYNRLTSKKKLEIVPGATHLFEEGNTLAVVAELAKQWFELHLS
ncbi:MAG: dienelactone hydrolase family protein [Bacteroidota bacterium]|nr:dienelactone hydrolase family protein [Bacteroidota bacterium]MDP4229657.1 dienelactone hydrolase family protein [Bacteroidota bacterium]MDP4236901.1 dienelactone hydrolase family protein [Bacteroidota bacterium]